MLLAINEIDKPLWELLLLDPRSCYCFIVECSVTTNKIVRLSESYDSNKR